MPVPDFQSLMLPVLRSLEGGAETAVPEIRSRVASDLELAPEDLREIVPSGRQSTLANRVNWALVHTQRAGLLERIRPRPTKASVRPVAEAVGTCPA